MVSWWCARWRRSTGWIASSAMRVRPKSTPNCRESRNEGTRTSHHGSEPGQVHRVSYLLGHLQECVDFAQGHGIRLVQQRRDQARNRLSEGLGEPGALERRL